MSEHELKCWPEFFAAILEGRKRHELRRAMEHGMSETPGFEAEVGVA